MNKARCQWCLKTDVEIEYHDKVWGVAVHDDIELYRFITLDAFQAGLSWLTILKKRDNFDKAFDGFDPNVIVAYDDKKTASLMNDAGIIRNRLKIAATINNARRFLDVQKEFGSFDKYIWQFTGGKTIVNKWKTVDEIPAVSEQAELMSKDMKSRGFKFCGPTICYAFMQAAGMVNDHTTDCYRYKELAHDTSVSSLRKSN